MKRVVFLLVAVLAAGCGRKGPPLPPLVKLPVPPADFTAVRRGGTVELQFTVPGTNTDNTRPANVSRVDVYALTGGTLGMSEADLFKNGAKVASVAVKAPRDPNLTTEVDVPADEAEEVEAPEGRGLDQGVVAHAEEKLTDASRVVPNLSRAAPRASAGDVPGPLIGPSLLAVPSRLYVGVGVSKNGRRGPASSRALVPLVPQPPAPSTVTATYDERAVTIAWAALADVNQPVGPVGDVLPSRPIGVAITTIAYNVYEAAVPTAGGAGPSPVALTKTPVADTRFSDTRMTWGTTRCYAVRAVKSVGSLTVESEAPEPTCVTLRDTFPPAAPKGLMAVAGQAAISLIWDPSEEPDIDGYIILRAPAPGAPLSSITPQTVHETTFRDGVPSGANYVYALRAVDRAGNVSPASATVEETAR